MERMKIEQKEEPLKAELRTADITRLETKKWSFSFFPLSFIFICILVKIIVRFKVARLQVWENLIFLSCMECLTIEYEELSISCMIKIDRVVVVLSDIE